EVHKFEIGAENSGWEKFIPLSVLHDPDEGYIVNDTCAIAIKVSCSTKEQLDKFMKL
ncbi:hypothetical protein MKX03_023584, partial [Papaver bracteatum]